MGSRSNAAGKHSRAGGESSRAGTQRLEQSNQGLPFRGRIRHSKAGEGAQGQALQSRRTSLVGFEDDTKVHQPCFLVGLETHKRTALLHHITRYLPRSGRVRSVIWRVSRCVGDQFFGGYCSTCEFSTSMRIASPLCFSILNGYGWPTDSCTFAHLRHWLR